MMGGLAMRTFVKSASMLAVLLATASATAQQKQQQGRGVITLAEVTIVGRVQKPIAAVDVNRLSPKLTLSERRQPLVERIEKAIYKEPF